MKVYLKSHPPLTHEMFIFRFSTDPHHRLSNADQSVLTQKRMSTVTNWPRYTKD